MVASTEGHSVNGEGRFGIILAPSNLGLWPSGVEQLPRALSDAGLFAALDAPVLAEIAVPAFSDIRDPATQMRNASAIADVALELSRKVDGCLNEGKVPLVLGGDCSILLGPMLALRRRGRFGLLFLDGHCDFCDPALEPHGEAASMDLALTTGRGPDVVARLDGLPRLVEDRDVVQFGFRAFDDDTHTFDGLSIYDTDIEVFDLPKIREMGFEAAVDEAVSLVTRDDLDGFFVHVDCDVVDDAVMPAVDYRSPGGLSFEELAQILNRAQRTGRLAGVEFTIFNPTLDADGSIARSLTGAIVDGLSEIGG